MKVLTQAEEDAHYHAVLKNGAVWGSTGLVASMAGALTMNRYFTSFRGLTLPLKAFAMTSVTTFALVIGADRGSRAYEQRMFEDAGIAWSDGSLEHALGLSDKLEEQKKMHYERLSPRAKLLCHFKQHQYHYVLGSWAASMLGSFGFIATQPMPFSQKIVQARMYAFDVQIHLPYWVSGNYLTTAVHKFKEGSPHELAERRAREQVSAAGGVVQGKSEPPE